MVRRSSWDENALENFAPVSAIIASARRARKYFPNPWIGTLPPVLESK
jgi:hypothetical protein